ncbi:POTRA domain-containing protein, partial [Telmatospirillum siberiense]
MSRCIDRRVGGVLALATLTVMISSARAEDGAPSAQPSPRLVDIYEYRVEGARTLPVEEVEAAVYPFLGPGKTSEDVEQARAALERTYAAKGFQTVAVSIPARQVKDGVVTLAVTEGTVGRLRVRGSHYYDIDAVKADAPSLTEGTVPDFNAVSRDIVALNQLPDRKVTP